MTASSSQASRSALVAAFASVYLIWGSTYLAIRFGVATIPPFLMAGVRFLLAGAAFAAWAWWRGAERPTARDWVTTGVIGTLMAFGGNGLMTWAMQTVPSGLAATLVSTVPLWVVGLDWARPGGTRPPGRVLLGLVLGFAGIALLVDPTDARGARDVDFVGATVSLVACSLWACGSIYSRHARQPSSQAMSSGLQMLGGGVVLMAVAVLNGEIGQFDPASIPAAATVAWAYVVVFGSVAYGSYLWLLKASTPARAATYAYVNPVIALVLGYLVLGEALSAWAMACSALILVAVLMVVSR